MIKKTVFSLSQRITEKKQGKQGESKEKFTHKNWARLCVGL